MDLSVLVWFIQSVMKAMGRKVTYRINRNNLTFSLHPVHGGCPQVFLILPKSNIFFEAVQWQSRVDWTKKSFSEWSLIHRNNQQQTDSFKTLSLQIFETRGRLWSMSESATWGELYWQFRSCHKKLQNLMRRKNAKTLTRQDIFIRQ